MYLLAPGADARIAVILINLYPSLMKLSLRFSLYVFLLLLSSCNRNAQVQLKSGMTLTSSATIAEAIYQFPAADALDMPVLSVKGENLVLDFNGATLDSGMDPTRPDAFTGLGLSVKGSNKITIKNLNIKGYKVALLAEGVDSLEIVNCDFSYNYRPKLYSQWDREDFADWLSYHNNEEEEWLRYGAGVYLKHCNHAIIKEVVIQQGQNGMLLSNCNQGLFYNNSIQFNSGLGIGLYRSSGNRVMHNRLDWNVRGYSHGKYQRGQDSAGILCYEQSHENTFAYNSATHSGDGFFLWAGQTTMDTGEGGCNDNLIYGNDFSQAPTNGVEVTFSRNKVINNVMEECRYGVWGGYSHESAIAGNQIADCDFGVAIEHGQDNRIERNRFHAVQTGVQIWERDQQPVDWGYAQARKVDSEDYLIKENLFSNVDIPLKIAGSDSVEVLGNILLDYELLLQEDQPNELLVFKNNKMYEGEDWGSARRFAKQNEVLSSGAVDTNHILLGAYDYMPPPLMDGIDAFLPEEHPRGRQYILMNEWGPYNFQYPSIWLREIKENEYIFLLMGPKGNWKAVGGEGLSGLNPKTGTFPATFKAYREKDSPEFAIQFEFIGEAFTDQFGQKVAKGAVVPFAFHRFEQAIDWTVSWYAYDPELESPSFADLAKEESLVQEQKDQLVYHWWGSPQEGVSADHFATLALAEPSFTPGTYQITISSDDGLRFYIDDELKIDHWQAHESAVKTIEVDLDGAHRFRVEHYDVTGLSALDFRIDKLAPSENL